MRYPTLGRAAAAAVLLSLAVVAAAATGLHSLMIWLVLASWLALLATTWTAFLAAAGPAGTASSHTGKVTTWFLVFLTYVACCWVAFAMGT